MTDVISARSGVETPVREGIQPAVADSTPWSTLRENVGRTVTVSRFMMIDGMPFPVSQDEDSAALITGRLVSAVGPDNRYSYARVCVATGVGSKGQEYRTTLPYSTEFAVYDEYAPGGVSVEAYSVKLVPEKRTFLQTATSWLKFWNLFK